MSTVGVKWLTFVRDSTAWSSWMLLIFSFVGEYYWAETSFDRENDQ